MPVALLEEEELLCAPVEVSTGLIQCICWKLLLRIGVRSAQVSEGHILHQRSESVITDPVAYTVPLVGETFAKA